MNSRATSTKTSYGKTALQVTGGLVVLAGVCYLISLPVLSQLSNSAASKESPSSKTSKAKRSAPSEPGLNWSTNPADSATGTTASSTAQPLDSTTNPFMTTPSTTTQFGGSVTQPDTASPPEETVHLFGKPTNINGY